MQARCQQCNRTIEIVPGHRPRKYCSSECRQKAYRRRHGVKQRPYKESRLSKLTTAVWTMEKKWPDLALQTYFVLYDIEEKCGEKLATKTAERILWEIDHARKQL